MALTEILGKIETAITDPTNGILKYVTDLSTAPNDEATKKAVIGLIGQLIVLVIQCVKAAIEPTA
jgi:hypothetical protein